MLRTNLYRTFLSKFRNWKTFMDFFVLFHQVSLLSRLHHKNLVRLEGFCDDGGQQVHIQPAECHLYIVIMFPELSSCTII